MHILYLSLRHIYPNSGVFIWLYLSVKLTCPILCHSYNIPISRAFLCSHLGSWNILLNIQWFSSRKLSSITFYTCITVHLKLAFSFWIYIKKSFDLYLFFKGKQICIDQSDLLTNISITNMTWLWTFINRTVVIMIRKVLFYRISQDFASNHTSLVNITITPIFQNNFQHASGRVVATGSILS